jgi:hypothetical protein
MSEVFAMGALNRPSAHRRRSANLYSGGRPKRLHHAPPPALAFRLMFYLRLETLHRAKPHRLERA